LLEAYSGVRKGDALPLVIKLEKLLSLQQVNQVMAHLQAMFKSLPYFLHEKYPEKFFHAAIHLLFTYMGVTVQSEVCTSDGRVDALVETATHIYIFEFKLDESADAALAQIREKKYYQAFWLKGKPVMGVGVNFSSQSKNIEGWSVAEML
ncbi:MAG: PD-(D/E)XK nuclease domain-containing protein, partial [Saprospiraceae bacterium]|nr:PD-(D/E)XK nuclease domain-containing protein [Saprospiraceae bacterium]